MTLQGHIAKWDKAARTFDSTATGVERRYGMTKAELFGRSEGKVLLVASGTGLDFRYFPPGLELYALDFSRKMLDQAKERTDDLEGGVKLVQADAQELGFKDSVFDTVVTSCTFCSVPDPVKGLVELRRVLKPGGRLLMFEHVRAGNPLLGLMMDVMTPVSRLFGPDLNRRTGDNIRKAGFKIVREFNVYLDVVKTFEAIRP